MSRLRKVGCDHEAAVGQGSDRHHGLERGHIEALAERDRDSVELAPMCRDQWRRILGPLRLPSRVSWPILRRNALWPSTPTIMAMRAVPMLDEWDEHFGNRQHPMRGVEVMDGEGAPVAQVFAGVDLAFQRHLVGISRAQWRSRWP